MTWVTQRQGAGHVVTRVPIVSAVTLHKRCTGPCLSIWAGEGLSPWSNQAHGPHQRCIQLGRRMSVRPLRARPAGPRPRPATVSRRFASPLSRRPEIGLPCVHHEKRTVGSRTADFHPRGGSGSIATNGHPRCLLFACRAHRRTMAELGRIPVTRYAAGIHGENPVGFGRVERLCDRFDSTQNGGILVSPCGLGEIVVPGHRSCDM